jgi:hypothetical protein
VAYGDYDSDGDLDGLINSQAAAPVLLRNDGGNRSSWLSIQLVGRRSNRSAVGTRILLRAAGLEQARETKAGSSYDSQNDPRVHFGLSDARQIEELEIRWPSGKFEKHAKLAANQAFLLDEERGLRRDAAK